MKRKRSPEFESVAFILVDMQPDFYTAILPSLEKHFPNLKANTQKMLSLCRENDIDIIHVAAEYNEDVSPWLEYRNEVDKGTRKPTVVPTFEQFAEPKEGETVVIKTSYDGFNGTNLDNLLRSRKKKVVYVGGIVTSACVHFTISSAFFKGYQTVMVEDCCGDRSREVHDYHNEVYGAHMFKQTSTEGFLEHARSMVAPRPAVTD